VNPTSALVELDGIAVRLGRTPVLRGLDLTVEPGEVVGIRGANGSGKTTLLRLVATLLRPSEGTGRVLGVGLTDSARYDIRRQVALIGHAPALYDELTLEENTEFVAQFCGASAERVAEVLDVVGLTGARTRRARECSAGMKRRAEFARVLLADARLLLFDEAQSGLDASAAPLVEHVIKSVVAADGAALVVSHQEDRTAAFTDRVLELDQGRLWEAA
jgi:heme exporter protein A